MKDLILIFLLAGLSFSTAAEMIFQESFPTHSRLTFNVAKNQLIIKKRENKVIIETLNSSIFETIVNDLSKLTLNPDVITEYKVTKDGYPANPLSIELNLKNSQIELFSFYRDSEAKFIVDFWTQEDKLISSSAAPTKTEVALPKVIPVTTEIKKVETETAKPVPNKLPVVSQDVVEVSKVNTKEKLEGYRDFRYGATFIWDYVALGPELEDDILLDRKIPDFFYPIKDRVYSKDDKEAHLQLMVNMYRLEKWGYLAKSIELYEKKYGKDGNVDTIDFIRANALLKKNLLDQNKSVTNSAVNILEAIETRTDDYELRKAIQRYLIQQARNANSPIKYLQLAKKMFVDAKKNFDKEMVTWSSKVILHALAELKQVEKIVQFINDIKAQKIISDQLFAAYTIYAHLLSNEIEEAIKFYSSNKSNWARPVHPAILFNMSEIFFRKANYEEAKVLFDQFIVDYGFHTRSSQVRLRLALTYDLQEKDPKVVKELYKAAIDRSTDAKTRFEAKIRYAALSVARKYELNSEDLEKLIFLNASNDERAHWDYNLKKLLWQTRLRTQIAQKRYQDALTYMASIPLESLNQFEQSVFIADGAEIIYGLIGKFHQEQDYTKAVKTWEVYKEIYEAKVAKNPSTYFLVAESYIKLGLYQSYQRVLTDLNKIKSFAHRTFPAWIDRIPRDLNTMLEELEIIKAMATADWEKARELASKLKVEKGQGKSGDEKSPIELEYYLATIEFNLKNYQQAVQMFEKMLTRENLGKNLRPTEVQNILAMYSECLYKTNQSQKFNRVGLALVKDLEQVKDMAATREKIMYMLIESISGEQNPDNKELSKLCTDFLLQYKATEYKWRVSLIQGVALLKAGDTTRGRDLLKEIIDAKDVPTMIKDLARSELISRELFKQI